MSFKVKGPHSFTIGYKPGYSTPDQVLPGENLPEDTPESDLLNLARNNNLTDENGGQYNVSVDAETGNEVLVKVVLDKKGNPVEQPVNVLGAQTGQPSDEEVAKTAEQAGGNASSQSGNSGQTINPVGA